MLRNIVIYIGRGSAEFIWNEKYYFYKSGILQNKDENNSLLYPIMSEVELSDLIDHLSKKEKLGSEIWLLNEMTKVHNLKLNKE